MDSKEHPVVQQGIKAAELISDVSCNCTFYSIFFSRFPVAESQASLLRPQPNPSQHCLDNMFGAFVTIKE